MLDTSETPRDRFFPLMTCIALVTVAIAFGPTYYVRFASTAAGPALSAAVHVHALLFTAWMLVFAAQVALVGAGHTRTHRFLGTGAALLIPVMGIVGIITAVHGARNGHNPGGPFPDALAFMVVPLGDIVVFSVLAGLGIAWRGHPDLHRRLMLYATIGGLLPPAITRLSFLGRRPAVMFGVFAVLLLMPALRDLWRRAPVRWTTVGLAVGLLITVPLRTAIGMTAAWRAFATWLVGA